MTKARSLAGLAGVVLFCIAPLRAPGIIFAGFDDGNTDESVDGYPGMAGDGWVDRWQTHPSYSPGVITVEDADPLSPGSGNYLQITNDDWDGNDRIYVSRQMQDGYGGVDLAAPHQTSFEFRADVLGDFLNRDHSGGRTRTYLRLYSNPNGSDNPNHHDHRWWVGVRSDLGYFEIRDGSTDPYGTGVRTIRGPDLVEGRTYFFLLDVDPADSLYKLTITDDEDNEFESGWLMFRRKADKADNPTIINDTGGDTIGLALPPPLHGIDGDPGFDTTEYVWTLDNVRHIPEPGTLVLLMAAGGLLTLGRRRP